MRTISFSGAVAASLVALGGAVPAAIASVSAPAGFTVVSIASVPQARELAALPNGDLLVGTEGRDVYIVSNAESVTPAAPEIFVTAPDELASGVAFSARRHEVFIATERAVYTSSYTPAARRATALHKVFSVRTGSIAPNSDGDVHRTTSVAFSDRNELLYVAVGSSCNACREADPTRAAIFQMTATGSDVIKRATRIRNAIALTTDPQTGELWAGDAGQDDLPFGHPYEFLDDVTLHHGVADYGWPECEENHHAYAAGAHCDDAVVPLAELPAYSTIIGAVFYPLAESGAYAFPAPYRGALFASAHGSWHVAPRGGFAAVPQVVWIAMRNGRPASPVDWGDPRAQWRAFLDGFQTAGTRERIGRPTGLAVGSQGSLFVADDAAGVVYRVRPKR